MMFLTMAIMTGCTGAAAKTAQEVFDAYNNGDAKKARQIYSEEIQGNEENEKAFDEKLNQAIESIIDNYNEESIDIGSAQEQISHYVDVFGESTCSMDGYENLKVIQSSKASYEKAKKSDEKEEYAKAYTLYERVSEKDSNYEDAQTRLGELSEILAEQAKQGKADTEQYMQKHESTIKSMQRYYGYNLYQDLYSRGINLVFLKEHHIDTDTYKGAMRNQLAMTGEDTDLIFQGINAYLLRLAAKQIKLAFEQAQKEVDDLHQRTKEGIQTAKLNGKQIGQKQGAKLTTQKSVTAKKFILKNSRTFNGSLDDKECIGYLKIAPNTFYKYKKELRAEQQ